MSDERALRDRHVEARGQTTGAPKGCCAHCADDWPCDTAKALDLLADRLERAMRDHILDPKAGWPHHRPDGDVNGCDDLCATDIVARLRSESPDSEPEAGT